MRMEAGAEAGYRTSEAQGFPSAWRACKVGGSCRVSRSLLEEKRVWREAPIIESCGSHLGCPLKNTEES